MAFDRDKIGHEYTAYRYEVCREKIREYARALGETDSRYYSDGDDCVAPPTFAAAFTVAKGNEAMFDDPDLETHSSLMHGGQVFLLSERPFRPGDVIICTPRIADISYRGHHERVTIEVDCRFEDTGDRAVVSRAMLVFLDSAPPRGERGTS